MSNYDAINLEHEALVLIVTSTFGNGDSPENGEVMNNYLPDVIRSNGPTNNSPASSVINWCQFNRTRCKLSDPPIVNSPSFI